jgi:TolB protein
MRRGIALLSWVVLAGGVAAALMVAFVAQPRSAGAAFPGKNGGIAFVSNRPGSNFYDIYKVTFTGTNVRHLTSDPGEEESPAFSPDGKQIAYEGPGVGDNASNIWVMNADGSGKRKVTVERRLPGDSRLNYDPAFSPGGRRIVFVRGYGQKDSAYDLYAIGVDGTGLRPVFDSSTAHPRDPSWSPDGKKVAFEYGDEIATVRPDGRHLAVLRPGYSPDWSPDGERIAFADQGEIYTMKADGSGVRPVTDSSRSHRAGYPAYSPGGGKIAFADYRDGDGEIYTISAVGAGEKRLTRNRANDLEPAWQPAQ